MPGLWFDVWDERGVFEAKLWPDESFPPDHKRDLRGDFLLHREAGGRPDVILDLNEMAYLNPFILGSMVAVRRQAGINKGLVVVCSATEEVLELIRISRLKTPFMVKQNLA